MRFVLITENLLSGALRLSQSLYAHDRTVVFKPILGASPNGKKNSVRMCLGRAAYDGRKRRIRRAAMALLLSMQRTQR